MFEKVLYIILGGTISIIIPFAQSLFRHRNTPLSDWGAVLSGIGDSMGGLIAWGVIVLILLGIGLIYDKVQKRHTLDAQTIRDKLLLKSISNAINNANKKQTKNIIDAIQQIGGQNGE